jgi:hypothetical protein
MEKAKHLQPINKLGFKLGPIRVGYGKSKISPANQQAWI